jgi:hypothetical protein
MGQFSGGFQFGLKSWWIGLLPPAWFAAMDDALSGSGASASWALAGCGLCATVIVLWLAFVKMAEDYQTGLQMLNEGVPVRRLARAGPSLLLKALGRPPLRWWLRDPATRAGFMLTSAYLFRDRDVKLRVYPGVAPMLVLPIVFLLPGRGGGGGGSFGMAFAGGYLGLVPLLGLSLLQHSQHWQASDVFRTAPLAGPAALCRGARRAVLCFLTLPVFIVFGLLAYLIRGSSSQLLLLVPGIFALPVYALVACLGGKGVPLSLPVDEARAASRGLRMIGVMLISLALSGLAMWAWSNGWFWWLMLCEVLVVTGLCAGMSRAISRAKWGSLE